MQQQANDAAEVNENDLDYFQNLQRSFNVAMESGSAGPFQPNPVAQPFDLPKDFNFNSSLKSEDLREYLWRFAGKVQVAMGGFRDPTFIDAHVIIFSQNTIAVINIQLKNLKICHRVCENLTKVNFEEVFPLYFK